MDRLAADGFVFDQFLVDSLDVTSLYRSYWYGRHALEGDTGSPRVRCRRRWAIAAFGRC